MPKVAKELSAIEVKRISAPGLHAVGGVAGLLLQVGTGNARSWILRVKIGSKRRDIGLGGFPTVSLAQARDMARGMREKIMQGIDPVEEKIAIKAQIEADQRRSITFDECAEKYIESAQAGWKNAKHAQQWTNTLNQYASPVIGRLPVSAVDLALVLKIIEPIWTTKNATANRLRGRIETVLSWATTHGYRKGDNPARWRGHLDTILPKPSNVQASKHFPALEFREINRFVTELRTKSSISARALEFAILTAARSGEVRGATWNEIDIDQRVWTISADRMKASKEQRIPLSDDTIKLLKSLPRFEDNPLLFPAPRGGVLTDPALGKVIKIMHTQEIENGKAGFIDRKLDNRIVTAHGFRSTFRDWAGETTAYPREVIEHALAHQLADKAEAAYARGSMFDKRRRLMDDWARFISNPSNQNTIIYNLMDHG